MPQFSITAALQTQADSQALSATVRQVQSAFQGVQINIDVRANASATARVLSQVRQEAQDTGRAFDALTGKIAGFAAGAVGLSRLASGFREVASEAAQFQREMTRLAQVSGDVSSDVRAVADEIGKVSTTFGTSSRELASAAVAFRQAGLSAGELGTALNSLGKASLAPNFGTVKETAESTIAVFRSFGQEAGNLENSLASINAVAGSLPVKAGEIAEGLKQAGIAAKQSGTSFNETIALFSALKATTQESADSIGSGLRLIFQRIQKPEVVESLGELGISLRRTKEEAAELGNVNLSGQFVGGYEAVRRLSQALKDLPSTDERFSGVVNQLGGARQGSKIAGLIQGFPDAEKALQSADFAGSLSGSAAKAQDDFLVRLSQIREQVSALGRALTEESGVKLFTELLLSGAKAATTLAGALTPLAPLAAGLLAGKLFQGAGAAAGRLLPGFARGGVVPGQGNTDSVPAVLMPGEFVVRKQAAQRIGYDTLSLLNQPGAHFADGGSVPALLALNNPDTLRQRDDVQLLTLTRGYKGAATKYVNQRIAYLESDQPPGFDISQRRTLEGVLFERYIQKHLTGFNAGAGLDFPSLGQQDKEALARLTGRSVDDLSNVSGLELKRTASSRNLLETLRKSAGTDGFALGGPVRGGVPAYLTPGEFVFGREAAARIGGPALHQMNSTGDFPAHGFASGGPVGFAFGGAVDVPIRQVVADRFQSATAGQTLSRESQLETYRAQEAAVRSELVAALRRQLLALNSSLTVAESERLAEQAYGEALKARAKVLRDSGGSIVGLSDTARQLQSQGAAPGGLSRFGVFSRGVRDNLGSIGTTGAFLASAYAPPLIERLTGPIAEGNLSEGARFGSAFGGGFAGLSAGAAVGSVFGPVGTGIGAAVGALAGFVSSLRDADDKIRQVRIDSSLRELSTLVHETASGSRALSSASLEAGAGRLNQILSETSKAAQDKTGVGDVTAFRAAQSLEFSKVAGPLLPQLAQVANRQIDQLGQDNPGAGAGEVFRQFRSSDFGSAATVALARGSDKSISQVEEQFRKAAESAVRLAGAQEQASAATLRLSSSLASFSLLTKGIQGAAISLSDLEAKSRLLSDTFEGRASGLPLAGPDAIRQFGAPDNGRQFLSAVERTTGQLGEPGAGLAQQARGLDLLARTLPDILREAGARPLLAGEEISQRVESALLRLSKQSGGVISQNQISDVVSRLNAIDREPGAFGKQLRERGSDRTADELLRDSLAPLEDVLSKASEALRDRANQFIAGIAANQSAIQKIADERVKADELSLAVVRNQALRRAENAGQPSNALDFISLEQLQRPLTNRQEALTGLQGPDAFSPDTIGRRFQGVTGELERVRQQREQAAPGSQGFSELTKRFTDLQSQAGNLQRALSSLTDAATQNAAIQEKLNRLRADEEGRLSAGERFLAAGPEEQLRFTRGGILAQQAQRAGNVDQFTTEQRRDVFDFLNATAGVKLGGLGGVTGADLKRQLIQNSFGGAFALPEGDKRTEDELKAALDANTERAAKAQERSIELQRELQGQFFQNLSDQNSRFLTELKSALLSVQVQQQKAQLDRLTGERQTVAGRAEQASLLSGAGLTDDTLKVLRAPDNIRRIQSIAAAQADLTKSQTDFSARIAGIGGQLGGVDLGARNFLVGAGPRGPVDTGLAIGASRDVRANISDVLQRSGLESFDVNRVSAGFQQANQAARGRLVDARGDAEQIAAILRENLTQAIQDEAPRALGDKFLGIAQQKQDLIRSTGLPLETLTPFLTSLQDNGSKLVDAIRSIDSIGKALNDLAAVDRQLVETNRALAGIQAQQSGPAPEAKAAGGLAGFRPSGTDTVPAMLTPGEFVINRDSARANLPLLQAVNAARGPVYRADGGPVDLEEELQRQAMISPGGSSAALLWERYGNALALQAGIPASHAEQFGTQLARQNYHIGQLKNLRSRQLLSGSSDFGAQLAVSSLGSLARANQQNEQSDFALSLLKRQVAESKGRAFGFSAGGVVPQYLAPGGFVPQVPGSLALGFGGYGGRLYTPAAYRNYSAAFAPTMYYRQQFGGLYTPQAYTGRLVNPYALRPAAPEPGQLANGQPAPFQDPYETYAAVQAALARKRGEVVDEKVPAAAPGFGGLGPLPGVNTPYDQNNPFGTDEARRQSFAVSTIAGLASGGLVRGPGGGDVVPALLSSGEFVMNRAAVSRIGAGALRFANGGLVGGDGAGPAGGAGISPEVAQALTQFNQQVTAFAGSLGGFGSNVQTLTQTFAVFSDAARQLSESLRNFPSTLNVQGEQRVEVVINGAEALARITPDLKSMIEEGVKAQLSRVFKEQLPDAHVNLD